MVQMGVPVNITPHMVRQDRVFANDSRPSEMECKWGKNWSPHLSNF